MMNKQDNKPFVTIREAVSITGLSERYLRTMHHENKLPCIMSGNRCLVDVKMLMEQMHKESLSVIKQ